MIAARSRPCKTSQHGPRHFGGTPPAHERIAAIDLGSNSDRVVVVEVEAGGHLEVVEELRTPLRLALALQPDGRLPQDAMADEVERRARPGRRPRLACDVDADRVCLSTQGDAPWHLAGLGDRFRAAFGRDLVVDGMPA